MSRDVSKLPERLREKKQYVELGQSAPSGTRGAESATAYDAVGFDNSFDMQHFKDTFELKVLQLDDERIVFDMINIDTSLANAFRRILIAEVPTMAIDKVYILANDSIIPDELLSHRLGLIPIKVQPDLFDEMSNDSAATFTNTIVFRLDVACRSSSRAGETSDQTDSQQNSTTILDEQGEVYSSHLKWIAQGDQAEVLADSGLPQPVTDEILIAKLAVGQRIELEAHAQKNVGGEHAKWSPCHVSYRLHPEIELREKVTGDDAKQLVDSCPMRVFDIEDLGGGTTSAVVARPRDCTMCRNCILDPKFEPKVRIKKKREHFIFTIETFGQMEPEVLLVKAIERLKEKCEKASEALRKLRDCDDDANSDGAGDGNGMEDDLE